MLAIREKNALRLQAISPEAAALGLQVGLSLADARSRVPHLDAGEADLGADTAFLDQLAAWALRWTPSVSVCAPDGLTLDITGASHLFGGEPGMVSQVRNALAREGVTVQTAIADTPGAGWALARFAPGTIAPVGAAEALVANLPVAALPVPAATLQWLGRLGLRTVGHLLAAPRGPLVTRFGSDLLAKLDEAAGRARAPLIHRPEPPSHSVAMRLPEPVVQTARVLDLTRRLAEQLAAQLEPLDLGGRAFCLHLFRADGATREVVVTTSRPLRDPGRITRLLTERLEAIDGGLEADYGFDRLMLEATRVAPLSWRPQSLTPDTQAPSPEGLASLVDRIGARLGPEAIRISRPGNSWQPERAACALSPLSVGKKARGMPRWAGAIPESVDGVPLRPTHLLPRPEPIEVIAAAPEGAPARFQWRRVARTVARAEGPERITAERWGRDGADNPSDGGLTRDYYRVEDTKGRRYWLFRAGLYDRETPTPTWYLHGLFP